MSKRSRNISYDSHTPQLQIIPSEDRKLLISGITPNHSKNRLLSDNKYPFMSQISKSPAKEIVAPSRYENEFIRYSENSFMNPRKKDFQFSSSKQYEHHNLSYVGQIVALEKRRKGRMLYRKKDLQKQGIDVQGKNIVELQFNKIKGQVSQPTQSCQPTVDKEVQIELNIEQMHYQMVRTQQKCKKMNAQ